MKILAIDTSCDETAVAVSRDNCILANILSSQVEFHAQWGGVVPIIAQRNHRERIDEVIRRALVQAKVKLEEIDAFAVTHGPGLAVALEVGVAKARELAVKYSKPLIAVNHMAGHIYANFALNRSGQSYSIPNKLLANPFPMITLLISGGHTELVYMKNHLDFEIVGKTLDDSIGEAFDKIARMLKWGYPGGPIIEEFAKQGDEDKFDFPVPMKSSGDLNFSYSGLKTAVMRVIKEIGTEGPSKFDTSSRFVQQEKGDDLYAPTLSKQPMFSLQKQDALDIAAGFQRAAAEELVIKTVNAVRQFKTKMVVLGGGVVNNTYVRRKLRLALRKIDVSLFYPQNEKLLGDNAAMIAVAAYFMAQRKQFIDPEQVDRIPNLSL